MRLQARQLLVQLGLWERHEAESMLPMLRGNVPVAFSAELQAAAIVSIVSIVSIVR